MNPFSNISINEFRISLTSEVLRTGRIIQLALPTGALLFMGAVLLVSMDKGTYYPDEDELFVVTFLSIVTIVMFVLLFTVGQYISRSRFSDENLSKAFVTDLYDEQGNSLNATPSQKAVALLRTALLIRTAMLEAPTFLGLATLIIASTGGYLFTVSWIWINTLPLIVLCGFVALTFPTSDRIVKSFETYIAKNKT